MGRTGRFPRGLASHSEQNSFICSGCCHSRFCSKKMSYNSEWSQEWTFISKSRQYELHALCTLFWCDVDISSNGKDSNIASRHGCVSANLIHHLVIFTWFFPLHILWDGSVLKSKNCVLFRTPLPGFPVSTSLPVQPWIQDSLPSSEKEECMHYG